MKRARRIAHWTFALLLLSLLTVSLAWAKPTTSEQARQVVANWLILAQKPLDASLGQQVKDLQTFADAGGPLYFVVYLEPAGLVFVPGDDLVEPIIGFAPEAKVYDPSGANPLGSLVNRDIPGRVLQAREQEAQARVQGLKFVLPTDSQKAQNKWTALQQGQKPLNLGPELDAGHLPGNPEDIWVAPLVQSKWSQGSVNDLHCYDFYTHWGNPDTYYPCGCVATAMAQVMRKHQHPTAGVSPASFPITVNGIDVNEPLVRGSLPGGAYDWANMPLVPDTSISLTQRQAIGALTHDAGAAAQMNYNVGGSGSTSRRATTALTNVFMYGNAKVSINTPSTIPGIQLFNMVNASLDAGFPVLFGIAGAPGGHEIVGDGYGNHWGTWYHHLNMGWSGSQDFWYNLPYADTNQGIFDTFDECVYNIFPSGTGEIISGRVTDSCGRPVAGVTVTASGPGSPPAAVTNARGIYAFPKVAANATYTIHASGTGYTDQTVTTGESVDNTIGCGNRWGVNFRATRPTATNPEYVLYNLGGLDLKVSVGYAINNNSIIAGGMRTNNTKAECNPCLWYETVKGQFTFLRCGTDIVDYGYLQDINDNNLAVGWASKSTWYPIQEQPVYAQQSGGNFVYNLLPIPTTGLSGHTPFGKAFGVNHSGQIVGQAVMNQSNLAGVYPAYWPNTSSLPQTNAGFGNFGGTSENWAARINDSGVIVGKQKGSLIRAFLWNGSNLTWLGPTDKNSEARSLSNLNPPTVVGLLGLFDYITNFGDRAVTFSGSTATPLNPTLGQAAHGINSKGQIVGGGPAFVYDSANGLRDLNTLVNEPDWNLTAAYDINENGEIVGEGWFGAGNCYSVKMAYMLRPLFTITATAGPGGVIAPNGAVKVIRGDDQTFSIIPNAGFQIANVAVDGNPRGAISSYTFTNVTANHTISATFTGGVTHTITASAGSGGSINPSGAVTVNHGASQTFTIAPLTGFQITDVVVDGTTHLGPVTTHTFNNVTADHTISASFVVRTFTISASAGSGGSINPSGAVTVNYGASQAFTITPLTGFQIADVVVDGTTHLGAVTGHTFTNVTADHSIAASFTPIIATYTITATAGTGGSISPSGSVTVNSGASQTFIISANAGYQIADVVVDGTTHLGAVASHTFTNVTANHTIAASFTPVTTTYTITAGAGSGGSISPSGSVTVNPGGSQTFTITPNSGYEVQDVLVDGVSKGQVTTFTFTNVTGNHTITVTFSKLAACQPFFDHFEGSALGASWIVKNPDPAYYSLANSRLRTQTLAGDLWEGTNDYQNLFLIPNPMANCDFQVTIKVLGFNPVDYYQQIGVIAYDDDDNYVMSSNMYNGGQLWELAQETGGAIDYIDDSADAAKSDFYLRLVKVGNTYRQFFSLDGVTYQERNQPVTYGNGAPQYLGFIALEGSGVTAAPVPVDIDYFSVEKLQGYPSLPPLLAFYPFEGSAMDVSGNGRHGQVNGATLTAAGYEGEAYNFTGTGNYIQAPLNINPSQSPKLTMGAWAKPTASDGRRWVLSHDNGDYDRGLAIFTGHWTAACGSGGYINPAPVVTGKWTFLAAVYDQAAGTVKLWVDDQLFIRTGVTLGEGFNYLRIGANPGYGEFFNGTIDNAFFFNGALTDAQIIAIRNGGSEAIRSAITGSGKGLPGILGLLLD